MPVKSRQSLRKIQTAGWARSARRHRASSRSSRVTPTIRTSRKFGLFRRLSITCRIETFFGASYPHSDAIEKDGQLGGLNKRYIWLIVSQKRNDDDQEEGQRREGHTIPIQSSPACIGMSKDGAMPKTVAR